MFQCLFHPNWTKWIIIKQSIVLLPNLVIELLQLPSSQCMEILYFHKEKATSSYQVG